MANRRLRKEMAEMARGLCKLGAIDRKTMRKICSLLSLVHRKGPKALA